MKIFTAIKTGFCRTCDWVMGEPSEEEEYVSPFLRVGMLRLVLFGVAIGIPFWWIADHIGAVFR